MLDFISGNAMYIILAAMIAAKVALSLRNNSETLARDFGVAAVGAAVLWALTQWFGVHPLIVVVGAALVLRAAVQAGALPDPSALRLLMELVLPLAAVWAVFEAYPDTTLRWIVAVLAFITVVVTSFPAPTIDGGWPIAWWFLLPSMLGFATFLLFPTLRGVYLSFTDWNLLANDGQWIGTENYERMFTSQWGADEDGQAQRFIEDDAFRQSLWVTIQYVVINIFTQTILAITIAVIMDRLTKSAAVRGILLMPWLLPNVVVGLLFLWLLDGNLGLINTMLGWIGIGPYNFLNDPNLVIPAVAGINTWKYMGYTALLIFAGLQTIPKNLYEAAALDGATELQMMRRITIPLLRPVLALVLVVTVVGSWQVFDTVQVATGGVGGRPGGPVNASRVIYLYIYQNAFNFNRLGYAATLSTVLFVILLIVTAFQLKLLRAGESDPG